MGKRGKVQTALEYAVTRVLLNGLGLLPRSLAVATGKGVGRIAYGLSDGLRRTGFRNLELAFPEMSESERALAEEHLALCSYCRRRYRFEEHLRRFVRQAVVAEPMPPELKARLAQLRTPLF